MDYATAAKCSSHVQMMLYVYSNVYFKATVFLFAVILSMSIQKCINLIANKIDE